MKWDLISAVCLERTPTITPLPTPIEKEMLNMLEKLELVNSLKSDHELWQEKGKKLAKNRKALEEADPDLASRQSSQDYEDACNDLMSTNRKLDKLLVVVIQKETGGKVSW